MGKLMNARAAERHYLFVDGGCLRASVKRISQEIFGDENAYGPHVQSLASGYDKVFYYDAVPGRERNEANAAYELRVQPEHDRFAQIQALDRVHVALGQIVGSDKRQKGVDVRLTVDMMTHAFKGNMTSATLFAGDADFVPLIRSLVSEGLHITLWHPPQANADLKGAADNTRLFSFATNVLCLTADGQVPAFQPRGAGSSPQGPRADGLEHIVAPDMRWIAGYWRKETLRIWRGGEGHIWAFVDLFAPGESLERALTAFDAVHSENLNSLGLDWIKT